MDLEDTFDSMAMFLIQISALAPAAPLTPLQMQAKMGLGWNLGNTLDAPTEGAWAAAAHESYIEAAAAVGFTTIRVPVQWGHHMLSTAPFTVNASWVARVQEVVGWCLKRDLVTIVNVHHDEWFENDPQNELPRLVALWSQIAEAFVGAPETLLFEVYNEPHATSFTAVDLNAMNAAVLPVIRAKHPTRIVVFGGLKFMNPSWIVSNPALLRWPDPTVDAQLMLEIHNYDPFDYAGGKTPTKTSWGSDADRAALREWMDAIGNWSAKTTVPLIYGEFGCTTLQNATTGRYAWYEAHAMEIKQRGWGATVWDDDGMFRIYDRATGLWDAALLRALGKLQKSGTKDSEVV